MTIRPRPVMNVAIAVALFLAGCLLFRHAVAEAVGRLIGLSMFLVSVSFLPIFVLVLGWFVYSVWARTYFRAWHIRRIRNSRYLRDAVDRGNHQE